VAVGISDKLDVVGKIPWRQTVQVSVDEHSQLEVDAFRRPQPVKDVARKTNEKNSSVFSLIRKP